MNSMDISAFASKLEHDIIMIVESRLQTICYEEMTKVIRAKVYDGHGNGVYGRTYEFLQAVTVDNFRVSGGTAEFDVHIDAEKMGVHKQRNFFAHGDFNGSDQRENIDTFLNNGTRGVNNIKGQPARQYWKAGFESLEKLCYNAMRNGLIAEGFEVI